MPNQIKNRALVDDQLTYDYSTPNFDIVARPVDMYTPPVPNASANQLINSLQLFQSGLKSWADYRAVQNAKDAESGMLLRAQNPDISAASGKTKAFIQGWEKMDGEIQAKQDYKKAIDDYLAQNSHLDPEEFNKGLTAISQQFTAGSTKEFLKGFVPNALSIEDSARDTYNRIQNQKIYEERQTKTMALFGSDISELALNSINKSMATDVKSLDEIVNNPVMYLQYYTNRDKITAEVAPKLRAYLNDKFKDFKSLGLSTKEISTLMLGVVDQISNQYAMPELLNYGFLKDTKGFAVNDNPELMKALEQARTRAENSQSTVLKEINSVLKTQREAELQARTSAYYTALLNPDATPQELAQVRAQLEQDSLIQSDASVYKDLLKESNTDLYRQGHPPVSIDAVLNDLDKKLYTRSITSRDLAAARMQLTKEDYRYYYNEWDQQRKEKEQKEKESWSLDKIADHNYGAIINSIKQFDSLNRWINSEYCEKGTIYLNALIRNFKNEHKRLPATQAEWDKIADTFHKKYPAGITSGTDVDSSKTTVLKFDSKGNLIK